MRIGRLVKQSNIMFRRILSVGVLNRNLMIRDYDCSLKQSQCVISKIIPRALTTKVHNDKKEEYTIKVNAAKETIVLIDDNNATDVYEYPFVWLRDNCQVGKMLFICD